jgi:hypothetical protein
VDRARRRALLTAALGFVLLDTRGKSSAASCSQVGRSPYSAGLHSSGGRYSPAVADCRYAIIGASKLESGSLPVYVYKRREGAVRGTLDYATAARFMMR